MNGEAWGALLAVAVLAGACFKFGVADVLTPVVIVLVLVLAARLTLFSGDTVRRMRWKIRFRLRPGPGFASLAEVWLRYGRLSALLFYGAQVRPSIPALARVVMPTTELGGVRLGRAQYGRRCYADGQHQRLYFGIQRSGKSGKLADDIIDHSGAVLVASSRRDLYDGTAGYRARRGDSAPLIFNPEGVGGLPLTFGWDILAGCEDPAEALRRAADLTGAVATEGEMRWWVEKATTALGSGFHAGALVADATRMAGDGMLPAAAPGVATLATGLHAASLSGADASLVWAWANAPNAEAGLVQQARNHPGASEALFAALTELSKPGKTSDSVKITMSKALMWMAVPELRGMVTGPQARTFDVASWLADRGTIYMIAPGGEAASCAPLFRCFASYVHRQAKMAGQRMPGGKYDPPLLLALDELHLCLAAGSLVLTRDGYVPIETVNVGDRVLTHAGRWRRVEAKVCTGTRPVVQVHAQGVADLRVTPDHKLWVRHGAGKRAKEQARRAEPGWTEAADTRGSYVNLPLPPVEDSPVSEQDWWVVGRWLGDGHRHRGAEGHLSWLVSCAHQELPELLARLGSRAGHVARYRTSYQVRLRVGADDPVRSVLVRCGRGAEAKTVPGEVLALCPAKAEALLSGYLSADGWYCASEDAWRASSVSRGLLLGMAMIAQRARGAVASVYAGRPPRKHVIEGRVVEARQEWTFAFSSGERQSRPQGGNSRSGWIDADGAWKKVRKITGTDAAEVWDIRVEGDASFVAEGCVVSNCPVDLPALLADSAGFGIQIAAVVHSMGQLEDKYGKAGADTVWSTTGTKMLFSGIQDPVTLRHAAELSGRLPGGDHHDYVIRPEAIMRLPARRALVFSANLSPVVVKARMAWKRPGVRFGRAPRPPLALPMRTAMEVEAELADMTSRLPTLAGAGGPNGADSDHS